MIGQLHIDGDVRLGGTVEGQVEATGDVDIDDEAKVTASLAGREVNIRGHVSGPVTARKRLVVAKSGSLNGDVRVARLVIQDGATFSGNVSMGHSVDAGPKPQTPEPPAPTPEPPTSRPATPQPVAMPQSVATPQSVAAPQSASAAQPATPRSAAPQPAAPRSAAPQPVTRPAAPAKAKPPPPPAKGKPKR